MQSAWAIGYALAALVELVVQDVLGFGWRAVFFVGVLPALFTFWVRRSVEEPAVWRASRDAAGARLARRRRSAGRCWASRSAAHPDERVHDVRVVGIQHLGAVLSAPAPSAGGIGLSERRDELVHRRDAGRHVVRLRDVRVRERSRSAASAPTSRYLVLAAAFGAAPTRRRRKPCALFVLGPVTAFFATGYFSGFGAVTAELYPTARARDRAGIHLQHRPRRQRRRALHRRRARPRRHGFPAGAVDRRGRLRAGRGVLDRSFRRRREGTSSDHVIPGFPFCCFVALVAIAASTQAASCSGSIASTTSRDRRSTSGCSARWKRRRRQRHGDGRAQRMALVPHPVRPSDRNRRADRLSVQAAATRMYLDLTRVRGKDFGVVRRARPRARARHHRRRSARSDRGAAVVRLVQQRPDAADAAGVADGLTRRARSDVCSPPARAAAADAGSPSRPPTDPAFEARATAVCRQRVNGEPEVCGTSGRRRVPGADAERLPRLRSTFVTRPTPDSPFRYS